MASSWWRHQGPEGHSPQQIERDCTFAGAWSGFARSVRLGSEPVAHGFVDVRMVEQVKMVQPAELSSVLGRERDMTAVGADAVSTARQDENVTDCAADRLRGVASDGGGDGIVAGFRHRALHARRVTRGTWHRPATVTRTHLWTDHPQWTASDSCRLGHAPRAATQRDGREACERSPRGRMGGRFWSAHRSRTAARTSRRAACWTLSFLAARFCLMVLLGFFMVVSRGDLSAMALPARPSARAVLAGRW